MKKKPVLVAIIGGSGSGKTWLCNKLCETLGSKAARLSQDDFYLDRSYLSPGRRARLNFDHPRGIDWKSFEKVLQNCLKGRKTAIPQYDFETHARKGNPRIFRPRPVIFVDGLWLLHVPRIRALFGLAIYLDCPTKVRLRRRLARDLLDRGRSATSVREQFRKTVEPMHQRFVEPQARRAGLVIRGTVQQQDVKEILHLLQNVTDMLQSTP